MPIIKRNKPTAPVDEIPSTGRPVAPNPLPKQTPVQEEDITLTPPSAPEKTPPPKSGGPGALARLLGGNVIMLRVLLLALIACIIYIIIQPQLTLANFAGRERVIVYDPSGPVYSIAPIMDFADAREMHISLIRDAIEAGWNRNPNGLMRPDKAKMLFLKPAMEKLEAEIKATSKDYQDKNFRQSVEIGKISVAATSDDIIQAVATVQLIRVGLLNGAPISESETKRINLHLMRNPNMYVNKRYPLAVADF
jgi:hypothetical protein